jgi:hypothetical protein
MTQIISTPIEQKHFQAARRKALLAAIRDAVLRRPNDLLKFEDVRARLNVRGQHAIGHMAVPLDRIVGSEGRYADFDRHFLPRASVERHRWSRVDRLMLETGTAPAVDLWKIGDVYFVRDGNHRVSVARQLGRHFIDAEVTELFVDMPLTPDLSLRDLLLNEEYNDFIEWTNLDRLRPGERLRISEPGGYLDLVRHINAHRRRLALRCGQPIDRDESVADWYDTVYTPIVRLIRERNLLRHFSGRTETDLYRWIMDHRDELGAQLRGELEAEAAPAAGGARARRRLRAVIADALRGVLQVFGV